MSIATTYELLYFPIRGRGELIRLILHYTQTLFTDTPVSDWSSIKAKMPMGQLPVLIERVGTEEYYFPQSMAIVRHLARVTGIYGETELERFRADIAAEGIQDWRMKLHTIAFPHYGGTAEQKEQFFSTYVPGTLAVYDRMLSENTYIAGGARPTFADLMLFDILDATLAIRSQVAAEYPRLLGYMDRIRALPTLAPYLESRRPSEFKQES